MADTKTLRVGVLTPVNTHRPVPIFDRPVVALPLTSGIGAAKVLLPLFVPASVRMRSIALVRHSGVYHASAASRDVQ